MQLIVPETSDLKRVLLVLGAIRDGLSPHYSCGLSVRQASYAVQTAMALRFVSRRNREYELSPAAVELLSFAPGSSAARAALRRAVMTMDLTVRVMPNLLDPNLSVEHVAKILEENPDTHLARTTAVKRAAALVGWRRQLDDRQSATTNAHTALIVHLSDIHIKADGTENPICSRAAAIANALAARFDIQRPDVCIIALTGDIAYSGDRTEYALATPFLGELRAQIDSRLKTPVHIVTTPGNHDCNFHQETSVRTTILDALTHDRIDQPIVNEATKVQEEYRNFSDMHENQLNSVYEALGVSISHLTFGNRSLRFDRYNTAWCSRKNEQQGGLFFRVPTFPTALPNSDAVLALFHHPYNWLDAHDAKLLQDHIDGTADIVLTGHEHTGARYRKVLETGEHTEFLEGRVLQDSAEPESSGFNAILLDFGSLTQESMTFQWAPGEQMYCLDDRFPPRPFLRSKLSARNRFQLLEAFAAQLRDPGEAYKHPRKRVLELNDIFVYPDLRPSFISNAQKATSPPIREPLLHILKEEKVLVLGGDLVGKTSFTKKVFEDLHREGIIPVLVAGNEIVSSASSDLASLRNRAFTRAYGNERLEQFLQLAMEKKALIVDDAHRSPLPENEADAAIVRLSDTFGYVIVVADEGLPMALLEARKDDGDSILGYETCVIEPLGHLKRYQLIEKWCYLARRAGDDHAVLSRRAQQLDELIAHAIGSSLLPTLPAMVLLCIQQIEASQDSALADGSFGHLYNALITRNLWNDGAATTDIGAKRKFLSLFAHRLYVTEKEDMQRQEWEALYDRYANDYDAAYPRTTFLQEILDSGLVSEDGDSVAFRYKYAYCFFVAEFISETMPHHSIKDEATALCSRLHHDESASILLFLAHLDRDGSIQEVLMDLSRNMLKPAEAFDLHSQLLPLGSSEHISKLTLDGETPERRRELDREKRDQLERESGPVSPDTQPKEIVQFIGALRTVHILGQLLKGAPGATVAERKREVLEECYSLSARNAASLIGLLVQHHGELVAEVAKLMIHQRPELADDMVAVKNQVRDFLIMVCEGIVYGAALHVSRSVGAASLARTFDRVAEKHRHNQLYQLFDIGIRLDHFSSFPEDKTTTLQKSLVGKPSPNNVLRRLVWRHLNLFPMKYDKRQRLCARFDIREKTLLIARRRSGSND
jgi:predicted MPP superfamily phosphohydrolase